MFFADGFQMSLNGPFYPEEAKKKGLDQSMIGITTGAQYLARLVGCLVVMTTANAFNQKYFFAFGALVIGISLFCFSQLTFGPSGPIFATMSTLCRIWIGFYSAGTWGTGFSNIASFYPKNEGLVAGFIESSYGAGQMIGPFLGNYLFELGGFSGPFIFAGALELFIGILCLLLIPSYASLSKDTKTPVIEEKKLEPDERSRFSGGRLSRISASSESDDETTDLPLPPKYISNFGYLISIPIVLSCLPIATVNSSLGFMSVALAPFLLEEFNVGSEGNAKYFFAIFGVTTVASAFMGTLIDRGFGGKFYASAIVFSAIGYFLLFLPSVYPKAHSTTFFYTALIFLGFSIAGAYTGSYIVTEKASILIGVRDPKTVKIGVVTALNFWLSVGITSGQILTGGYIYNQTSFYIASLAQCIMIVVFGVPTIFWMWKNKLLAQIYYHEIAPQLLIDEKIESGPPITNNFVHEATLSVNDISRMHYMSSIGRSNGESINALISSTLRF
ncbi:MFS-type transporter SLC18B1-like [Symsagittifera roscoffensis]|uniref:MFS-type transporter SLC18B1-like n=1 Tax=Symsagittifera roscoffensis TaxID=84072 RepID=UPI00307B66D6